MSGRSEGWSGRMRSLFPHFSAGRARSRSGAVAPLSQPIRAISTLSPLLAEPPGPQPAREGAPIRAGESLGWELRELSFRYRGEAHFAIDSLSLAIGSGRLTAIVGPNGSGKSTLVKLLLGTAAPAGGEIRFGGRAIRAWKRRELARTVGVVPQSETLAFPLSVEELVAMGRYPHLGALRPAGPLDREVIRQSMERCRVAHLAHRPMETLSGGERQRARIARAFAQEPGALVLDEPTRALDLRHEMEIFELARLLADQGTTVVLVTHHLNLASRYADAIALMHEGRLAGSGAPEAVLRRDLLEAVFEWPLRLRREVVAAGPGAIQVDPLSRTLAGSPDRPFPNMNARYDEADQEQ